MAKQIAKVKQPPPRRKKENVQTLGSYTNKTGHDMHPNLRQPEHKLQAMTFYYD
jgi:hypothetical protein